MKFKSKGHKRPPRSLHVTNKRRQIKQAVVKDRESTASMTLLGF